MNEELVQAYEQQGMTLLASQDDWDLFANRSNDGVPRRHQLFIVSSKDDAELDHINFEAVIGAMNNGGRMGKGYTLTWHSTPSPGCVITVGKGWHVLNPTQAKLFLSRFLSLVGLGS